MIKVTNGKGEKFNGTNDDGVVRAIIANDCTNDAVDLVASKNLLRVSKKALKMPSCFSTVVECKDGDEYNRRDGIDLACKKLVRKHQLSQYKAIKRWRDENMLKLLAYKPNILRTYDKRNFRAEIVRDKIVKDIKQKFKEWGATKAVVRISGGVDDVVCAGLLARALGAENVYGFIIPYQGQYDKTAVFRIINELGIRGVVLNIRDLDIHLDLSTVGENTEIDKVKATLTDKAKSYVLPVLVTTILQFRAQNLDAKLCGTTNLGDYFVGQCTKSEYNAYDFNPVGLLTAWEVEQVGLSMSELSVIPVEGDDEFTQMGVTRENVHMVIRAGSCGNKEVDKIIMDMHNKAEGKYKPVYKMLQDVFGDIKNKYLDYIR